MSALKEAGTFATVGALIGFGVGFVKGIMNAPETDTSVPEIEVLKNHMYEIFGLEAANLVAADLYALHELSQQPITLSSPQEAFAIKDRIERTLQTLQAETSQEAAPKAEQPMEEILAYASGLAQNITMDADAQMY